MASFNPKVYELGTKTEPHRLLTANSKIWSIPGGVYVVDPAGLLTALDIINICGDVAHARHQLAPSRGVTEILPTTA